MSRLLLTNIRKCSRLECPFYHFDWVWIEQDKKSSCISKCTLSSEDGKEIKELEADGFPKFCGLEKVKKDD